MTEHRPNCEALVSSQLRGVCDLICLVSKGFKHAANVIVMSFSNAL
jgi:hypothetical protein